MTEWLTLVITNWPPLGLIATLLMGVFIAARYLRTVEMNDMRKRVEYLDKQVRALRHRDECYFDWVIVNESYYNRLELAAAMASYPLEPRVSFLEFRQQWMASRGLKDDWDSIWQ